MKSKFNILFEQVMNLLLESIMSDIDSLSVSDEDKQTLKSWSDQKKQKAAIFWIRHNVNNDLKKIEQATYIVKDFTAINTSDKFNALFQNISSDQSATLEANTTNVLKMTNPETGKRIFTNPYPSETSEVVIYQVDDSKYGQKAIRIAADQVWGVDFNGWCIISRKSKFGERQLTDINRMSEEDKKNIGLYSDDDLEIGWHYWQKHSSYPKRAAFKNGKIFAFSASGKNEKIIEWWDKADKPHIDAKEILGIEDDMEFLKKYGYESYLIFAPLNKDEIFKLANDKNETIRAAIAKRKNLPKEIIEKLANDEDMWVRIEVAAREDLPEEIEEKLLNHDSRLVKAAFCKRKNLTIEQFMNFIKKADVSTRQMIAKDETTPMKYIEILANDKNRYVRSVIAGRLDITPEIVEKLSHDKCAEIRDEIARKAKFRHF